MTNNIKEYDRPATLPGLRATQEAENAHFLNFLKGDDASLLLSAADDGVEEFGATDNIVAAVSGDEIAMDGYVERLDSLLGAAHDAQAVVEVYIDRCGYRDDMLNASNRILAGDPGGWDDLIASAEYCQHSTQKLAIELRRNLRKLNVKGMNYRMASHYARLANNERLGRERTAKHGPLTSRGGIGDDVFEVRGGTHPMLYVYRKVGGRYVEKCTQLGGMDAMTLAQQLLAELPGGPN